MVEACFEWILGFVKKLQGLVKSVSECSKQFLKKTKLSTISAAVCKVLSFWLKRGLWYVYHMGVNF